VRNDKIYATFATVSAIKGRNMGLDYWHYQVGSDQLVLAVYRSLRPSYYLHSNLLDLCANFIFEKDPFIYFI
jgi:hypothetical protein